MNTKLYTIQREYGKTPNGNDLNGRWVLRKQGEFIDFDKYRNDLLERYDLRSRDCVWLSR